jgi:DMSO/TMAO reductase YedYZ molybdopterin-dependent catalytic subunit
MNITNATRLPPGQHLLDHFPRFGKPEFAGRLPRDPRPLELAIGGEVEQPITVSGELGQLPRREQTSDFHCVTTWSVQGVRWGGYRFSDFFRQIVLPRARPRADIRWVRFRCQDGYDSSLPLEDLLADSVLLADTLEGQALGIEHGAPLRLVAPAHYGYKNPKHLSAIELWRTERPPGDLAERLMIHPRARVALEERSPGLPGWLLRYLYRPTIQPIIRSIRAATAEPHHPPLRTPG